MANQGKIMGVWILILFLLVILIPAKGSKPISGWIGPVLIENHEAGAYNAHIEIDDRGNVMTIWQEPGRIGWNNFTPGIGWGKNGGLINTGGPCLVYDAYLSGNDQGDFFVIYIKDEGLQTVWVNRFSPGIGWLPAERLDPYNDFMNSSYPMIEVGDSGDAFAMWVRSDLNICVSHFIPGRGWELPPVSVIGIMTFKEDTKDIAVDPSGNAIAVWTMNNGMNWNIYSAYYCNGTGWGESELVEKRSGKASHPQVVIDPSGNALAIWQQSDGLKDDIWSNEYNTKSGWGTPVLIENLDKSSITPRIAMSNSGNASAAWRQIDGTTATVWTNLYIPSIGWGTPAAVQKDLGHVDSQDISINNQGKTVVVWCQYDSNIGHIWLNRYLPDSGWGIAEMVENNRTNNAARPRIELDEAGTEYVVWDQFDGTRTNIWFAKYIVPDTVPPDLVLNAPIDGYVTDRPFVTIVGKTDPTSLLRVNGYIVDVSENGSFLYDINLRDGPNIINVSSSDPSGNTITALRNVFYENPLLDILNRIRSLENSTADIIESIGEFDGMMKEISQRIDLLEASMNATIKEILENITSIEGLIGELRTEIEGIHTMLANLDDGMNSSNLQIIERELTNLSSYLNRTSERIDSIETDWSESDLILQELRENLTELRSDLDAAKEDIVEIKGTSPDGELEYLKSDLDDMRAQFHNLNNAVFLGFLLILFLMICVIVSFYYRSKRSQKTIEGLDPQKRENYIRPWSSQHGSDRED